MVLLKQFDKNIVYVTNEILAKIIKHVGQRHSGQDKMSKSISGDIKLKYIAFIKEYYKIDNVGKTSCLNLQAQKELDTWFISNYMKKYKEEHKKGDDE